MRYLFTLLIISLLSFKSTAQMYSVDDFEWEKRLLLIYSQDDEQLELQLAQIKQVKASFANRDLLVVLIKNGQAELWNSEEKGQINYMRLMNTFDIDRSQNYANYLIGKDGTVKLEQNSAILNNKLFSTIDAMPMRKKELWDDQ